MAKFTVVCQQLNMRWLPYKGETELSEWDNMELSGVREKELLSSSAAGKPAV